MIEAVDFAGNARQAEAFVPQSFGWPFAALLAVLILILVAVFLALKKLKPKSG